MALCAECQVQARRQAEQMKPRECREGMALLARNDALAAYGSLPLPDVRIGDVVKVTLVAGAVEDMGWCEKHGCDNNYHLGRT